MGIGEWQATSLESGLRCMCTGGPDMVGNGADLLNAVDEI